MNYRLRSKPKHEHRPKIIVVIGLFLFLSLFAFLFPNITRSSFVTLARPLWVVSDTIAASIISVEDYFTFKSALIKKNLALEDELLSLKLKEADYDLISGEVLDLKAELGRGNSKSLISSRVLSKPPRSPYDTLVVDTGTSDGVALGSKVYLSKNIIIGLVASVTPHTSLVQLFSSGGEKQIAVLSRTGASFELEGRGGANFQIEAPKDTDILLNDVLEYPGVSPSIIGSVYYIDSNSQSSFKKVYVRIPVNVFSVKWVSIEKSQ